MIVEDDEPPFVDDDIRKRRCSLYRGRSLYKASKLLVNVNSELQCSDSVLIETTGSSIITNLKSLEEHSPVSSGTWSFGNLSEGTLSKMLLHFDGQMRDVHRDVLDDNKHRELLNFNTK